MKFLKEEKLNKKPLCGFLFLKHSINGDNYTQNCFA